MPILDRRPSELEHPISRAVDFLCRSQLDYGEFRTYAWSDEKQAADCEFEPSTFVTSLVLYSLGFLHEDRIEAMTAKSLDFLCAEMEGSGLWRYWSSRNERHDLLPPDLDCTCCISFVLSRFSRYVPPNRDLILANRNGEGHFYTWMVPRADSEPHFGDALRPLVNPTVVKALSILGVLDLIDCAVNANAVLYLGESAETRHALDYLLDVVLQRREGTCSQFYLNRLSLYYMLSRACFNGVSALVETREPVTDRIIAMQQSEGSWGNALQTALAVCTLLNFDKPGPYLNRGVEYLLTAQREDGSWTRIPMYHGRSPYYGSEELTTALCLEALARCR